MSVYLNKQPTPGEREIAFICANRQRLTLNGRYAHIPDVHLLKIGHGGEHQGTRLSVSGTQPTRGHRGGGAAEAGTRRHRNRRTAVRRSFPAPATSAPLAAGQGHVVGGVHGHARCLGGRTGHRLSVRSGPGDRQQGGRRHTGDLTILTADTDKHVCVAVEAYDKRPPVEVEGWENHRGRLPEHHRRHGVHRRRG